jgi:hypothetical protein
MPFSYAVVSANRRSLGVCDMQQDGNGVYGYFWLTNGTELKVRDPNGSAGGCGNMSDLPAPIKKFTCLRTFLSLWSLIHTMNIRL